MNQTFGLCIEGCIEIGDSIAVMSSGYLLCTILVVLLIISKLVLCGGWYFLVYYIWDWGSKYIKSTPSQQSSVWEKESEFTQITVHHLE